MTIDVEHYSETLFVEKYLVKIWHDLTHLFPMHPSSTPENIRKMEGFLLFSGSREMVHWEEMGYLSCIKICKNMLKNSVLGIKSHFNVWQLSKMEK